MPEHIAAAAVLGGLLVGGYVLGTRLPWTVGAVAVAGLIGLGELIFGILQGGAVPVVFLAVVPWVVARELTTRRELGVALAKRNYELEVEENVHARLAVRRERARIARELHDIVGHHLAVIAVQAGAGRMATTPQMVHAPERLSSIRLAGGRALVEMDLLMDIVGADREHEIAGRLREIVEGARAAGVTVRCDAAPNVPAELGDVTCRVVQEALTNAVKHAAGAAVVVELVTRDDRLRIEVRDAGGMASPALSGSGGGTGLSGMRERVAAASGNLEAGPHGTGWRVIAELPLPPTTGAEEDTSEG